MPYYGKVHNKGTVTTLKNYTRVEGEGSSRSNDLSIARGISDGLAGSVGRAMSIAYDAHKRSMGWD